MNRCRWSSLAVAGLLAATLGSSVAAAQGADGFPQRPITIVVPYPPGGPPDVIARMIAIPLEAELGKPIVIDNKPGASTSIGTALVARAAADGYTLLAVEPSFVVAPNTL